MSDYFVDIYVDKLPTCNANSLPLSMFFLTACALGTICCFGLLGNLLAVMLLINRYLKHSTFRHYLRALCVSDSGVLFFNLWLHVMPTLTERLATNERLVSAANHIAFIAYPLAMATQTMSNWLIVLMTILRLLSIRSPFITRKSTNARTAKGLVFFTCTVAVLYNIPRAFEYELANCRLLNGAPITALNESQMRHNSTVFKLLYYIGGYAFFIFLVPAASLLICNSYIAYHLAHDTPSKYLRIHCSQRRFARRRFLSTLLAVVACEHLVCNAIPLASNIYEMKMQSNLNDTFFWLKNFGVFALCFQSSSNFFIHLMFNSEFRALSTSETTSGQRYSAQLCHSPVVRIKLERCASLQAQPTQCFSDGVAENTSLLQVRSASWGTTDARANLHLMDSRRPSLLFLK